MKYVMLFVLVFSSVLQAEVITLDKCENRGVDLRTVMPGQANQHSYYNFDVTLYRYNQEEPAAAPEGIAIVYPSKDSTAEPMAWMDCVVVPYFSYVDIAAAKSSYDPEHGLTVKIPVKEYDATLDHARSATLTLKIRGHKNGDFVYYEIEATK